MAPCCFRKLRMWYTRKEFDVAPVKEKIWFYLLPILAIIFNVRCIIYHLCHDPNKTSTASMQKIPYYSMMFGSVFIRFFAQYHGKDYLELLKVIRTLREEMLNRPDHPKYRPLQNRLYICTISMMILLGVTAIFFPIPLILHTITTGELYFKTILPFGSTPYSLPVYVQCAIHLVTLWWLEIYCLFFIPIILEPYLRFAISFKIIAKDMRTLRKDGTNFTEEGEYDRLRSMMFQCGELSR